MGPPINTSFDDFGPALSKDGLSLYFTSSRPGGAGSMDLWVSQRSTKDAAWEPPENLGAPVNSAASEHVPALSRDGHWLFFNSTRAGGFGGQDIWASWRADIRDNFAWTAPFNLGEGVNSTFVDVNPAYFENDETGAPLLFFTSNRPGGPGAFDVYVSQLESSGWFGRATLVSELSSGSAEQRPSIRFDGLEILLVRSPAGLPLSGDLWESTREAAIDPWSSPTDLGATINTEFHEAHPYLAADRQTLVFSSDRADGFGGLDLYVTTRTKNP
jgi:Tol biopolymer transport system component